MGGGGGEGAVERVMCASECCWDELQSVMGHSNPTTRFLLLSLSFSLSLSLSLFLYLSISRCREVGGWG